MHPNPRFHESDRERLLAKVARVGFAHLFVAAADAAIMAHAPLTRHGDALRFHVARGNRVTPHLHDGTRLLASVAACHGYVSPNWYADTADQVPTWNYDTVEIEGTLRRLDEAELREQLDALADAHEPRPGPWTLGKTDPSVAAGLIRAIVGFELGVDAIRGTAKLSQNKAPVDRAGAIAGLRARGNVALAAAMAAA